jgi:hypothetical protein
MGVGGRGGAADGVVGECCPVDGRIRAFAGGRQKTVSRFVIGDRQTHLLQVVLALGAGGGLADFLHGWQEQTDEDGDDGNHYQQLNQSETAVTSSEGKSGHSSFSFIFEGRSPW